MLSDTSLGEYNNVIEQLGSFLFSSKSREKGIWALSQYFMQVKMVDNLSKVMYGWSWEENKLFEMALAVVDQEDPNRWEVVAAMVGGKRSAEDVQKHYVILLQDLRCIEDGQLDHVLVAEAQPQPPQPCVQQTGCTEPICWNDEDNELLAECDIN